MKIKDLTCDFQKKSNANIVLFCQKQVFFSKKGAELWVGMGFAGIWGNKFWLIKERNKTMSLFRVILSIIFPPLAVLDKGCGSVLIVTLLTCCGWIPGVIGALVILNKKTTVVNYPTYPSHR